MKQAFACLLLLLITFPVSAQQSGFRKFLKLHPKFQSLDLIYTEKIFQHDFYGQFNDLSTYSLKNAATYIGFGQTGYLLAGPRSDVNVNNAYIVTGRLSFSVMIPRDIVIQDSITGKISGFDFKISGIGFDLLHRQKKSDILIYASLHTGNIRMFKNELIRQKNAFVSSQISICPRFKLGKIALALDMSYEYDISGTSWRRTLFASKDNKVELDKFRQSGFNASASIGIAF